MKIKRWHLWLGVLISAVFLFLAFRKVDFAQVWHYLKQAKWAWVLFGLGIYFIGVFLRSLRWQVLLNPVKQLPIKRLFPVICIGYMGNNVYPARAGEVLRSVLLKQKDNVDISASLATIVVERLFDAITILGLVLLNLGQFAQKEGLAWVSKLAVIGSAVFGLMLLVFLAMVFLPVPATQFFGWFINLIVPAKLRPAAMSIIRKFILGLGALRSPLEALKVLLFSCLIWLAEAGLYWGVMKALGLNLSFIQLLLIEGIVNLVLLIPAAPGGLGTFDAAAKAMLELFGVSSNLALGYALLLRVALWVPITLLGAVLFFREGFSLSTDLNALQKEYKAQEPAALAEISPQEAENKQQRSFMTHSPKNIAIIGAGIGGLSAAYDLNKAGQKVRLFEASDHAGGLAEGFKEPHWDWSVERYYHHWFASDKHILGLIAELGWSDQVVFPTPVTVMYHRGKFYPFDSIKSALLYPGLGFGINKIRFGLVGVYLRLTNNWRALEKYTTEKWMRAKAGNKVYETMWEPMMIGKFGEKWAKKVNMAWMWARLHARTTKLGTFKGGFQRFADQFAEYLAQQGVQISYQSAVNSIQKQYDGRLELGFKDGRKEIFDQVLVTLSPALMAKMAPELPSDYLQGLLSLHSMGAVVMTLSLNQQLSPEAYYWYSIPKKAGFPFLALVEHTNYLKPEYFGGDHILYIGDYLETDHPNFQKTDEELKAEFLPYLKKINPAFDESWVKKVWVSKTAYAQPIPLLNHSQNIPAIQTPVEGLYFASMSQVYPWDRGTNFAVEIGRRAARLMLGK
ncbi:MAG: flippase-like domain-containing protein [Anaerolineaceae bacterium]|nr:flippase-like domain-containing protein [Anaerolineaceae bacterium]